MPTVERLNLPADPLQWRPQVADSAHHHIPITDPIVEPLWSGWRVLVHFDAARAERSRLIDVLGDDSAPSHPEIVAELATAVLGADAVIDGILTQQATRSGEGIAVLHDAHLSPTSVLLSRKPDVDVDRWKPDETSPIALVCLDLLRVDGQDLFDVPLLERKRLLEGLVSGGDLVRVSPFVRPPANPWIATWKAAGFKGAILKSANGRYVPGRKAEDWIPMTRVAGR